MNLSRTPLLLWLLFAIVADSIAAPPNRRIGLVLEGGGALGFAHVGVLKVLEEERIPVHLIAGTSMGSIVGAAYASGRTLTEIEEIITSTDWDALFNETAPRRMVQYRRKGGRDGEPYGEPKVGIKDGEIVTAAAFVEGQYIELVCQRLFGKSDASRSFDELPIPFRAVAADIATGEAIILDRGSLALAARASMSVPGFFAPVEIDGRLLVDGGVINNFPVDIALEMGAEVLVAVQFQTALKGKAELGGPLAVSGQILNLLLRQTSQQGLALLRPRDVLIQPDIKQYSSTSFTDAAAIVEAGVTAARALVPRLRELAVSEAEYARFNEARTSGGEYLPELEFIRVEGVEPHRAKRIQATLKQELGKPLDCTALEGAITEHYQSGEFTKINYEVQTKNGKTGLVVKAQEKDWLKNFVRLGFSLEDDFDGSSFYSVAVNPRFNDLNRWGAYADLQLEIGRFPKILGEFYQPIGKDGWFFLAPTFDVGRRPLTIRRGHDEVARYFRETALIGLKGGISLGRYGEASVGLQRGSGDVELDIGEPALPEFDYDIGAAVGFFTLDQLDNPDFPTEGYRVALTGLASRDSLGASDNYEQGRFIATVPVTFGQVTFLLNGETGLSSDDTPVEQSYGLGGMFDISGYEQGALTADNYWVGRSALYYRFLKGQSSLVTFGGYLGGTVEYASLRSDFDEIGDRPGIFAGSIFLGIDTPLLPIYLSYGMSDESESSVYLNVGKLQARRR